MNKIYFSHSTSFLLNFNLLFYIKKIKPRFLKKNYIPGILGTDEQ